MASQVFGSFLSIILIFLSVNIESGEALKCYECMSTSSTTADECSGEMITKSSSVHTVECSISTMKAWHMRVQKNPSFQNIENIFDVDGSQINNQIHVNMKCAKLTFRVDGAPVTMRTCQTAESANMKNPCDSIIKRLPKHQKDETPYCGLCEGDLCNNAYIFSASIATTFIPLIASLLMANLFQTA
ncbi:hypothetical protein HCN44_000119 [Aphidius gifuensis]|uniref:Protein sleepless n=1 Tax=Aphidius gifuensis TaxID=684658 RepID=A0A835CN01_APHGI|nr:uncharacterized protein LOC122855310 [Aphidius gifuensis]KAF7990314.1 hypothetical protein HCN44_000119 [Aphidius gifuensis]